MTSFFNFDDIIKSGKKYKIIYADPPWKYWAGGLKNAAVHYDVMEIEDIKKLPINQIADEHSVLCMWSTWPILPESLDVIKSWGFDYSTMIFIWIKQNKITNSWFVGCGNYTRANTEFILLGKRGMGIARKRADLSQVVTYEIGEHSEKPNIFRTKIIQLFGEQEKIELFSRKPIHGWDTFGNDEKLQLKPLESF